MAKGTTETSRADATQEKRFEATSYPETEAFFKNDDLRVRCFLDKYSLRDEDGIPQEKTPKEMWKRIAREMSSAEETKAKKTEWDKKFYWLLDDFRFVPGGRIMFGAGQKRNATLLNCYVLPIKEDSLEGIFDWCKEAARTYSFGGGCGVDISILRPRNSRVNNSALYSTGSVSFMELFSTTTGTIGQAGRRGALMITISADHPDLEEFIDIKADNITNVRFANISVRITEGFMKAAQAGKKYTLTYENDIIGEYSREVDAKAIWKKLVTAARNSAEPGLIFWDNVKKESTTEYNGMEVTSTNPCSEIPLEPYGCCCLGNINLTKFVSGEFEETAEVDWENLDQALRYATRFLDNVLTYNKKKHPLPQQTEASLWSRRIGVGFTGFGDMLIKLGLKYDSKEAIAFTDKLFERIKNTIYDESVNLGIEKGKFPAYEYKKHIKSPFIKRLDKKVLARIRKHGLRNAALITVPPVGSGSVLAGTTSGIEPIFALSYTRRSESLSQEYYKVYHPLVKDYMSRFGVEGEEELPDTFVTSHQIDAMSRVRIQAAIQKHIDHAISSTINLAEDITVEEVNDIYVEAWKAGCKGVTVYREGSREGILITDEKQSEIDGEEQEEETAQAVSAAPRPRQQVLSGQTYKMETEMGHVYVTINRNGHGPFETFIQIGKSGSSSMAFTEAIGRLISLSLRSGVNPQEIVDHLHLIRGARPVMQEDGEVVFSVPDAIARALDKFLKNEKEQMELLEVPRSEAPALNESETLVFDEEVTADATIGSESSEEAQSPVAQTSSEPIAQVRSVDVCPKCGGVLQFTGGCYICGDCAYSKCD